MSEDILVKAGVGSGFMQGTTHLTQYMNEIHHCSPLAAAALAVPLPGALFWRPPVREAVTVRFKGDGPLGQVMADARDYTVRGFVMRNEKVMLPSKTAKLDVGGGVGHYGIVTVAVPEKGRTLYRVSPEKWGNRCGPDQIRGVRVRADLPALPWAS